MNQPVDHSDFFFFSREKMNVLANSLKDRYASAAPFPHIVIDDFLPRDFALVVGKAFPGIDDIPWKFEGPGHSKHSGDKRIEKVSASDEEQFPDSIRLMMMQFQSGIFCNFLDRLSGVEHLQPDPHHFGCGLHSTGSGGRLMLHLDSSRHPNQDLNQVINVVYYCTPEWDAAYGGDLELWNEDATERVVSIAPVFNRLVVFRVSGKSWHGHPRPAQCPKQIRRNSLALYYYTTDKAVTGYKYSNFVRWKAATEHDKKAPIHVVTSVIGAVLPTPAVNALYGLYRKARDSKRPK